MTDIQYTLRRNKRLIGNINLRIKDGEVFVSAPFWVSKSVIEKFVESKVSWISKSLAKHNFEKIKKTYENGEQHTLFGQDYSLSIKHSSTVTRTIVEISDNQLTLVIYQNYLGEKYIQEAQKAFTAFYMSQLSYYLTDRVNYYTNLLGCDYKKIDIKKVSSIWGSCSPKNVLCFNRKLIQAPKQIIDYVVIHEVCHLKERNHSSRFWSLVRKFDNNYKDHRRWLHQNQTKLYL